MVGTCGYSHGIGDWNGYCDDLLRNPRVCSAGALVVKLLVVEHECHVDTSRSQHTKKFAVNHIMIIR